MATRKNKSNVEKSQDDLIQSRLNSLTWYSNSRERKYEEKSKQDAQHRMLDVT